MSIAADALHAGSDVHPVDGDLGGFSDDQDRNGTASA